MYKCIGRIAGKALLVIYDTVMSNTLHGHPAYPSSLNCFSINRCLDGIKIVQFKTQMQHCVVINRKSLSVASMSSDDY